MSIRGKFPEQRPTLNLDFANSKKLDPRITFSRSNDQGDATYVDENGLVVTAAADEPRFDHDPETGESLGLLIEEERTNLLPYSEDITNADWTIFGTATRSANTTTAPDGTTTADSITLPSGSGIYDNRPISAETTYTFSAWIKGTAGDTIRILINPNISGPNSKTVTVTDEWVRYDVTHTTGASDTTASFQFDQGNGDTFYVWGMQGEAGEFTTSYIPTSGSTATRSPDSVTMTGTNFSDWYNQDEGTVYVSQKLRAVQDTDRNNLVYLINGGSGNDCFYNTKHGNQHIFVFGDGGTNYSRFGDGSDSTDSKTAWAYDVSGDDFKPYYNGIESTTETTTNTPSATSHTQLELGATAGAKYCGHISKFTYYPSRLPNDQLQSLTK